MMIEQAETVTRREGRKMEHTINVTTPSGKPVVITFDHARLLIDLPAANVKTYGHAVHALKTPKMGATHYIDSNPPIGLDTLAAKTVQDAIDSRKAAYQASPEGQAEALRKEREQLQYEILGWSDKIDHAKERAHNDDTGRAWAAVRAAEQGWESAKATLADWDAAHPAIIESIKAERAEQTRRFLERD
jgi:hypothetical protein